MGEYICHICGTHWPDARGYECPNKAHHPPAPPRDDVVRLLASGRFIGINDDGVIASAYDESEDLPADWTIEQQILLAVAMVSRWQQKLVRLQSAASGEVPQGGS